MCMLAEYCCMCVLKCLCVFESVCVSRGLKGCQRQHPASQHAVGYIAPPPLLPLSYSISLSVYPSLFLILLFLLSLAPSLFLCFSLHFTFSLITHSLRAKQTHHNPVALADCPQTRHTLRRIQLAKSRPFETKTNSDKKSQREI